MIMFFSVIMLSRLYIMENVPHNLMGILTSISENTIVILLMLNLFMIIIGMLMDDTSAILLSTPILLPIAIQLGVSPVQFAWLPVLLLTTFVPGFATWLPSLILGPQIIN